MIKKCWRTPLLFLLAILLLGTAGAAFYLKAASEREEIPADPDEAFSYLRDLYTESRAEYIFGEFGMDPASYTPMRDFELLGSIPADDYIAMREALDIQIGTTVPFFFVSDDVIYGVCQDADAINRMCEFSKETDGSWALRDTREPQDAGRYQDIHQSFREFQAAMS